WFTKPDATQRQRRPTLCHVVVTLGFGANDTRERVRLRTRTRNAAQIGEHLTRGMDRQGPRLEADDPVGRDSVELLCAPHCGLGVRAVDAVQREYRVGAWCE